MSQRSLMLNMNSIHLKTNELLRYHCSFHGNLVAVALKYAVDDYYPKKSLMPKMNSVQFKTHELLRYHFRCHGNLVTIASRYVADAYHHKDNSYQI